MPVFNEHLFPGIFFVVETIQPFDLDSLLLLGVGREDISDIEPFGHPPAIPDLASGVAGQHRGIGQVDFALLVETAGHRSIA
jgi:hypothetical protein